MPGVDLFVGCVRVSTDEQTKGHSPAEQERALRAYADGLGAREVVILRDHISGTIPIRQRPGGAELYRYIDARRHGCAVAFDRVDRISRDMHLAELPALMRDLHVAGIEFHIIGKGRIPLDDPLHSFILVAESFSAAQSNVDRSRASSRGRRAKATSGRVVGNGRPPYPFDREGERRSLVYRVNPQRAAWVREIARRIVAGESSESCARWLETIGAPTPGSMWGRPARGWYSTTVVKVLRNPALTGRFRYGDQVVVDETLRVIDDGTAEAVAAALAQHRADSARNRKAEYLLSGRLFCSCGRRMVGRPGGPGSRWYYCTSRDYRRRTLSCGERYVRGDGVSGADLLVWNEVLAWCTDPERIRVGVRDRNESLADSVAPARAALSEVATALIAEQRRLDRLVATLGDVGEAAAGVIQSRVMETARRVADLDTRRSDLARQIAAPGLVIDEQTVVDQVGEVIADMQAAPFERRRRHLAILGVECHVDDDVNAGRVLRIELRSLDGIQFSVGI